MIRISANLTTANLTTANLTTANLTTDNITELTALVRTRRKRVQYRPGLLVSFLAGTRLEFEPLL